jgi:F-type H+-transporting ATPase subunit b
MGETLQTLGIQWPKLIAQVINFAIVMFVLWKWAYKPVLNMLELRRQKIAEGMANADRIKTELAATEVNRREILDQANVDANKFIEQARLSAAKILEQETQKAIATANEIASKARQASEAELARMKTELRREVGRLVVATSAKVTGNILTTEQQGQLAEQTAKELAA